MNPAPAPVAQVDRKVREVQEYLTSESLSQSNPAYDPKGVDGVIATKTRTAAVAYLKVNDELVRNGTLNADQLSDNDIIARMSAFL